MYITIVQVVCLKTIYKEIDLSHKLQFNLNYDNKINEKK